MKYTIILYLHNIYYYIMATTIEEDKQLLNNQLNQLQQLVIQLRETSERLSRNEVPANEVPANEVPILRKKGRVFKFTPAGLGYPSVEQWTEHVGQRERLSIRLPEHKVKSTSIQEGDYLFIQFKGRITHYAICSENIDLNTTEIYVREFITLSSSFPAMPGQGFSFLNHEQIMNYLL